jgi:parallel beta-helix repeat protein
MKKTIALWIVFLFVLMSFTSISGIQINNQIVKTSGRGDILYVGGSGPGNYSVIQYAVDNASSGNTVLVYSGIYDDYFPNNMACVLIEKSINLIGEDKNSTIIKGSGVHRVVKIRANGVNVTGFTLKDGGCPEPSTWGIGIDVGVPVKNIVIADNIIVHNQHGISVDHEPNDVLIYDNIIRDNRYGIYTAFSVKNCEIYNNTITHNKCGIYSQLCEILIHDNNVSDNNNGFRLYNVESTCIIERNHIKDNINGLSASYSKAIIRSNNFIGNGNHTKLDKSFPLIFMLDMLKYRQKWNFNYWDDWLKDNPRPIIGSVTIFITIIKLWPRPHTIAIPIISFPFYEYDWNPAKQPYDIGV